MNLYQGATQNMKLHLYLRMNILKTIPLWIKFNFSLSHNIIYISGWNLRYVTNHLIFYSFNTFILISVFSNLFWSFNMGRKQKGNGPAAQQDDGEASGQRSGRGKTAGRGQDDGAAAGWRRRCGTTAGWCATWRSRSWRGWPCSWCHCSTFKEDLLEGSTDVESSVRCRKRSRRIPQLW